MENFRGKYSQSTMTVIREAISLAIDRIPVNGGLREKIIEDAVDMLDKDTQLDKKNKKTVDFVEGHLLHYYHIRESLFRCNNLESFFVRITNSLHDRSRPCRENRRIL